MECTTGTNWATERACWIPTGTLGEGGVIAIDTSLAAVTVTVLEPLTEDSGNAARTVVVPRALARPRPRLPSTLESTIALLSAPHVTALVKSCVVLSLNTPVAENCTEVPRGTVSAAGVTPSETKVFAVTFRDALVRIPLAASSAWIVLTPTPLLLASPSLPEALDTVAVPLVTLQATSGVTGR
jgi:hypothetical protein